jgi:hypothetical protein
MEFRIAPMILIVLNCLFLVYCLFNLQEATIKQSGIGFGLVALAYGASLSHSYYTKQFMNTFYILAGLCVAVSGYILYYCLR